MIDSTEHTHAQHPTDAHHPDRTLRPVPQAGKMVADGLNRTTPDRLGDRLISIQTDIYPTMDFRSPRFHAVMEGGDAGSRMA